MQLSLDRADRAYIKEISDMSNNRFKAFKNQLFKNAIAAFIDQYLGNALEKIPVITLDKITQFQALPLIVVAVPHQFEKIKQDILEVRMAAQVICVNVLF